MKEILTKPYELIKRHPVIGAVALTTVVELVDATILGSNNSIATSGALLLGGGALWEAYRLIEGTVTDFEDFNDRVLLNPGQKPSH